MKSSKMKVCCLLQEVHRACYVKFSGATVFWNLLNYCEVCTGGLKICKIISDIDLSCQSILFWWPLHDIWTFKPFGRHLSATFPNSLTVFIISNCNKLTKYGQNNYTDTLTSWVIWSEQRNWTAIGLVGQVQCPVNHKLQLFLFLIQFLYKKIIMLHIIFTILVGFL